ncbi:hypothetical protein HPB51_023561 [Rhipicephalus microplus]|uniref:Uncharacterized protein n=1 Tax=Rhipicephalus microplus TaxID=6941 RepID=A0A9J6DCT9_RHIMP|nr:hypothetical protein HPB51_023561 [Rhipicephalus microplus]
MPEIARLRYAFAFKSSIASAADHGTRSSSVSALAGDKVAPEPLALTALHVNASALAGVGRSRYFYRSRQRASSWELASPNGPVCCTGRRREQQFRRVHDGGGTGDEHRARPGCVTLDRVKSAAVKSEDPSRGAALGVPTALWRLGHVSAGRGNRGPNPARQHSRSPPAEGEQWSCDE